MSTPEAAQGVARDARPRHSGTVAVEVARGHGVRTQWTLSGAHVFPMYDGAVKADPPMRLVDVRHEQTAVFAAEGEAKLERTPGLAVLTAGPGVTNGVSGVTTARFNGSPLLVVGGRAPAARWGQGSLQELDHPPLLAPVTKHAATVGSADEVAGAVDAALRIAGTPHRGPVFLDVPMDVFFSPTDAPLPAVRTATVVEPDPDDVARVAALLAGAARPVVVLGGDVWAGRAEDAARRLVEELGLPVVANGQGRGVVPSSSPLAVTPVRSAALGRADLVVVVGTPLDFRLGFGVFGGREGSPAAQVVHVADSPAGVARHVPLAGSAAGDLTAVCDALLAETGRRGGVDAAAWREDLADRAARRRAEDAELRQAGGDRVHPVRVYGELERVLEPDAVVIGDGGDFVSYAGKHVASERPGCWLDPGPYGCLGTGLGYAMAARVNRPSSQVVLLLGDGAAGFSLMDVDTLVRHGLPVVLVVGNNGMWGLEKGPMQMLYGYDVAADLRRETRYDQVVTALGGGGELVERPDDLAPALARALAADVPYCLNVMTDPDAQYPRATTGV